MTISFIWFDILTLVIIFLLGIKGILNGFIKEVFGLIGIIGGVFLASRFASEFALIISKYITHIENQSALFLVGFLSVFFIFWIICIAIGFIISKIVAASSLTMIDKMFGFIISSIKIFLVLSIFVFALSRIDFIKVNFFDKYISHSFMYECFIRMGKIIVNIDTKNIKDSFNEVSESIIETDEKIKDGLNEKNWQY